MEVNMLSTVYCCLPVGNRLVERIAVLFVCILLETVTLENIEINVEYYRAKVRAMNIALNKVFRNCLFFLSTLIA